VAVCRLAVGVAYAAEPTAEEVVARHVEARGGRAWEEIRSLEIKGTMTSWSRKAPFTLLRTRDGRYLLDSVQGDRSVRVLSDGRTAWWVNHWYQLSPVSVRGADLAAVLREVDLPNPFFHWRERGYELAVVPGASFEGQPAIGLRVKRADGLAETWYLDPKTWLEMGRESPGSNFGEQVPMTTYYDDFRPVHGLLIPHRIESHWASRENVMEVESVRANVEVDDASFVMPEPPGMEALYPLVGRWNVSMSERFHPGAPWRDTRSESTIAKMLGGGLLQERHVTTFGHEGLRSFTYDRLHRRYRVTSINEATTTLDVKEGRFDDLKRLVLSNETTGTAARRTAGVLIERLTLSEITPDGFVMERETSSDGGREWFLAGRATYRRLEAPVAP
jgi:hypothetical protein